MSDETGHLSDLALRSYRRRTMSPADLIIADEHLAKCDACYRRITVRSSDDDEALTMSFETTVSRAHATHLSYEQIAAYVDDKLDDVDREICNVHLEVCSHCAAELRDLDAFRAAITQSPLVHGQTKSPPRKTFISFLIPAQWSSFQFAAAAIIVILLLGGVVWLVWIRGRSSNSEVVKSTGPTSSPTTGFTPTPAQVTPPEIVVTLNDNGTQVTLDKNGTVAGLENLSSPHQQAIKTVLTTGRLQVPADIAELKRKGGVLMGRRTEGVAFALRSPVGVVVVTNRPTFRWHALEGASSYVVDIYDSGFSKVTTSPQLSQPQWTSVNSLRRGLVYFWQVTAIKDGQQIKSPVSPAPEARFKVLDANRVAELTRAKREHPNSHLLLGTLYAQAGLLEDAERELRALVAENPKAILPQQLLHELQAIR